MVVASLNLTFALAQLVLGGVVMNSCGPVWSCHLRLPNSQPIHHQVVHGQEYHQPNEDLPQLKEAMIYFKMKC